MRAGDRKQGIYKAWPNAPSHKKYPSDGLNAADMNVHPGGKQPIMRDTTWNGTHQSMVLSDGQSKGMKFVLQERGINTKGLNTAKMRDIYYIK